MKFRAARSFLVALALVAAVAATARAEPALVVVGGSFNDPAIYDEVLRLAGPNARVGILTLGSPPRKAEKNGKFYIKKFAERGATASWISIDRDRPELAEDAALAEQVRGYDVVVLGGGSQRYYADVLLRKDGSDTALMAAIRQGAGRSGVVAGTSAGAAVLVDRAMITGGESYDALTRPRAVTDRPQGGIGLFPWGLIDTHFSERGRQARLLRLAARRGVELSFGVDENTALVVTGGRARPDFRVVGRGGVTVLDTTQARRPGKSTREIANVRVHYLTAGDRFDPRMRRARVASGKMRDRGRASVRAVDVADVFSAYDSKLKRRPRTHSFVRLLKAAMTAGRGPVVAHPGDARWDVILRRGRGARRYRDPAGRTPRSVVNARIDIRRARR